MRINKGLDVLMKVFSVREQRTLTYKTLKYNIIKQGCRNRDSLIQHSSFIIPHSYLNAFSLNPLPLKAKSFM